MNVRRRTVLLGSLVVPLLAAQSLSARAIATNWTGELFLVRQAGIPESARFVESWYSRHAGTFVFDSDVSELNERLITLWQHHGATALAGFTTNAAFFCLSHIAADHGLRVLHRQIHVPGAPEPPSLVAARVERVLDRFADHRPLALFDALPNSEHAFASWLLVPRAWLTRRLS